MGPIFARRALALAGLAMLAPAVWADPATQPASAPAGTPATAPAVAADDHQLKLDNQWRHARAEIRNSSRRRILDMPVAVTFKAGLPLQLSVVSGLLQVEASPMGSAAAVRVAVAGSDACWTISRRRVRAGSLVHVTRYDFDAGEDEIWHTQVVVNDQYINLSAQYIGGFTSIFQAAGSITVRVSQFAQAGQPVKCVYMTQASSLERMRDADPAEFRKYVLPVLQKFADPGLMDPGPGDVYSAFVEIPADQMALQSIQQLAPSLDADDPADRDLASARLRQLGVPGVLAALRVDTSEWSEEQKLRLRSFVLAYRHRPAADPAIARRDLSFLLDCLEFDDPAVRLAAKAELERQTGHACPFDPLLTGGAAASDVDALRKRLLGRPVMAPSAPATQPAPQS